MNAPSTEQIAARWDFSSHTYDNWGRHPTYQRAWLATLADLVGHPRRDDSPALRIADIGTGTGQVAIPLAQLGHHVTGYDIAPSMLGRARAKAAEASLSATFTQANAYELPLDDASVDLVIGRMVLWTLYDPPAALREWRRVLAPGGRIIAIDGLWYTTPAHYNRVQKARHVIQNQLWAWRGRLRRRRGPYFWAGDYRSDAVRSPGMDWRSAEDARAHFTQAGLDGTQLRWLQPLFEVERRTTTLWKKLVYAPQPFFALTWQRRDEDASHGAPDPLGREEANR